MFHIVLYEPEIPPNTGNIIRLCANTGCHLHLIHPLGFRLDDAHMRRAGLDYREWATVAEHKNLEEFARVVRPPRTFALSTKARTHYNQVRFRAHDAFLFGPETRGLPNTVLATQDPKQLLRIPMLASSRSLNLANSVAIVVYEAWRQMRFQGGA